MPGMDGVDRGSPTWARRPGVAGLPPVAGAGHPTTRQPTVKCQRVEAGRKPATLLQDGPPRTKTLSLRARVPPGPRARADAPVALSPVGWRPPGLNEPVFFSGRLPRGGPPRSNKNAEPGNSGPLKNRVAGAGRTTGRPPPRPPRPCFPNQRGPVPKSPPEMNMLRRSLFRVSPGTRRRAVGRRPFSTVSLPFHPPGKPPDA